MSRRNETLYYARQRQMKTDNAPKKKHCHCGAPVSYHRYLDHRSNKPVIVVFNDDGTLHTCDSFDDQDEIVLDRKP